MKPTIKKSKPVQGTLFDHAEGVDRKMYGVGNAAKIMEKMKVKPKYFKLYKK